MMDIWSSGHGEPDGFILRWHLLFHDRSGGQQRGHLSAHASEGQCVEYANCEILAKLKIELSVNITKYQLI